MMALSALIHKSKTVPVATLTVATQDTETRPSVATVASVAVANPTESKTIQPGDRQKLLDYLAAIGETDQDIIDEFLAECSKEPLWEMSETDLAELDECMEDCQKYADILARQLQQAEDFFQIEKGDYTGLVKCSGCRHLSGDACNFHGWRVVADKWRRCSDHDNNLVSVTCKACNHFQSFNKHGGGAGTCSAGVQSLGVCWWADTLHECTQYSQK